MKHVEITRKIASLREKYLDDDSSQYLNDVEKTLEDLLEQRDFLKHPVFKKIETMCSKKVNEMSALLMNDETLTDKEREKLFARREAVRFVSKKFSVAVVDEALDTLNEVLDARIKQK